MYSRRKDTGWTGLGLGLNGPKYCRCCYVINLILSGLSVCLYDSSFFAVNFTVKFQTEHARAPNEKGELAIFSQKRCKIGPRYYDELIGSRICAFDWYQNHRPWMTLNGRYALFCRKDAEASNDSGIIVDDGSFRRFSWLLLRKL